MFIIVFYGLFSVLNAINRTAEHVCLILQGMKMVYGAVSASKQAAPTFWMYIFNVLSMMNSVVITGSRPNGERWQKFPKAAAHHWHRAEIELCACIGILSYFCWSVCICTYPTDRAKQPTSQTARTCLAGEANISSSASCIQLWSGRLDTDIEMLSWTNKEVWCGNCWPCKGNCLRQDEKQTVHQGRQDRLMSSPKQRTLTHTLQNGSLAGDNKKIGNRCGIFS